MPTYTKDYAQITRHVSGRPSHWPVAGLIGGGMAILFIVAVLVVVQSVAYAAGGFDLHALLEFAAGL